METKLKIAFLILGITFGLFQKFDRKSRADAFEKEKAEIIQKGEKEKLLLTHELSHEIDSLFCILDSLRAELNSQKAQGILTKAKSLSDLDSVAKFLNSLNYNDYRAIENFHPEILEKLYKLGQKFFCSEVIRISSREEFKKFKEKCNLVEQIVPLYCADLGNALLIYFEKEKKFGK